MWTQPVLLLVLPGQDLMISKLEKKTGFINVQIISVAAVIFVIENNYLLEKVSCRFSFWAYEPTLLKKIESFISRAMVDNLPFCH
jgi:hypothetical protein